MARRNARPSLPTRGKRERSWTCWRRLKFRKTGHARHRPLERLLAKIDRIDEKLLYVEQETYPGSPLDSVRRDYAYISSLEF